MSADERTGNLLGALALTLADHIGTGSDAAALITLRNYAEGEPLDLLRRALALSHPGVVRLADRLERRGLVERRRSDRDGRAVALRLTSAGRRAADEALAARAQAIDGALGAISATERRALEGMLERMLAAQTTDRTASLVICRLCDPDVCGHPEGCPVTQAAREAAA
jgi:MarR family transcriptional repressor of emrRAB